MISDLAALNEIALDIRSSWNHAADELWQQIAPELWDLTSNPWIVLQTVSRDQLKRTLEDPLFRQKLDRVMQERRDTAERRRWFEKTWPAAPVSAIAYFSMEFMLAESLPIYSGGLGNVAGDQLKAANDLGVPVIGIGLLYATGYFRQHIDSAGNQIALRPFNDPGQLPITPVRNAEGEWLRIPLTLPGGTVRIRTWRVQVGTRVLYLLDTNDPANLPEHRGITSELYGGGPEVRIEQERVLGVAGWRVLRALGIEAEVCHLNEGHAAFAVLERAREFKERTGCSFEIALAATRAGNVFTTHTPVAAGFDRFSADLMRERFRNYAEAELGISIADLLALGQSEAGDSNEAFNMAYLAVRGSNAVNGVSRLHGEVSRRIFQPLFPRWPETQVPIGHITNGVHTPTWDSEPSDALWTAACGKDRWREDLTAIENDFRRVPREDLWRMRNANRRNLVEFVRGRLARQIAGHGGGTGEREVATRVLDPETLTIGFARRFAAYKRPDLLLHDQERLLRILTDTKRPAQLILAGKAHPQDYEGQQLVRRWVEFIRGTAARAQAVFLSDYDMRLAQTITQGVDVWINTPRRPWEASGTSGMKVLVNGGVNLSELDGWWAEAWSDDVGWALGDGREHGSDPAWDNVEAHALYDLLEKEIVPSFYERDAAGVPVRWVDRMRESMARLTPAFSANRAVREYTEQFYIPAANGWRQRSAERGRATADLVVWRHQIEEHWPRLRFGSLQVDTDGSRHTFTAQVFLDELNPDFVSVQLFAEGQSGKPPFCEAMSRGAALIGSGNAFAWSLRVEASRPASDYTPRIVPAHPLAKVPLDCNRILWRD